MAKITYIDYTGDGVQIKVDNGNKYKVNYFRYSEIYYIYKMDENGNWKEMGSYNSIFQNKLEKIKVKILAGKYD